MECDRGFGQLETEYKKTKLHCPQDFYRAASKMNNADVVRLGPDDMLDLKKMSKHFKHGKAKKLLFSKAKRVFLSKQFPLEMIIECYDIPTKLFEKETVNLGPKDGDITELKSTEEFQKYYLKNSVESETEQQELLPTLRTSKFKAILPKKLREGWVMEVNKKKIKDVFGLSMYTTKEATQWILDLTKRQEQENLRKRSRIQNDDKIYDDPENYPDELDLDSDQESAMVVNEDYHNEEMEGAPEKTKGKKSTGGNKRTAAKGNLFIDLNPAISNNNAMTLILNNEMKFKERTKNIHKVLIITFF